ncbi:unnamed protein product [Thelazia callipaeda]|uniref:Signal recognition particle subunit SRP68 n=1 Tax=Thelazia callipaeda TaxID=103827 RepID=A0A158RBP6_THECL|nr:unnamed protein product [Thelazia callipaeda]
MTSADYQKKEGAVLASFATLSILQLIKDAQQKHGLRHGDYQRYRGYCARRVRRIRKSLGFTNVHKGIPKHPAKFVSRKLIFDAVTEERYLSTQFIVINKVTAFVRYLQIAVFDAERNWSYAMQLKQEAGEDIHSRKRFHMIAKLRRAVKHSSNLESVTKSCDRVDAVTKLESQAYSSWMNGCLHFELKKWKGALEYFRTAKKIYENLAAVVALSDLMELYKARCREIQPQMRYCEFNCGDDASRDAAMSEMINMRLQLGEEGALQDDFDKLIAELRTKATMCHAKDIEWGNEKISVTNDGVKNLLQALEQFDKELAQTTTYEDKMTLYEQLLGNIRDVIQTLNEEQKKFAGSGKSIDGRSNQLITVYLEFVRLTRTIERYIMIITHTREQTDKKVKPQDLIRLCDTVIENCCEILALPGISFNKDLEAVYKIKAEYYRAFRCFCMAEAFVIVLKWNEADALYDRAAERIKNASDMLSNAKGNSLILESEDNLKNLLKQITSSKFAAQANRLAEIANNCKEVVKEKTHYNKPLINTLDEFRKIEPDDLHNEEKSFRVIAMPPSFIPMPTKPMFFDLALNHIKASQFLMPDLESKIASYSVDKKETPKRGQRKNKGPISNKEESDASQQGIGGLVKGWFWRK